MERLARWCAIAAGLFLTAITLLTCASIVGREVWGKTLIGDFELSAAAAGLAIALFMPLCHLRGGNIIVDAFTLRANPMTVQRLDRLGALCVALLMALLAWRTTVGAASAWNAHSASMLMGFPDWLVYAGMVPPLVLTACIALWQCVQGIAPEAHA
jgi:TRAP-type C4-dicarboxylate transport system permease small subunit